MAETPSFSPFAPGFEFLQTLVKNAGAALPSIGQWVAPTLDPDELAKRIEELRTIQFWLEQNARMLGATIQAMEVQKMTLSTLKTMNVQMEDLRESMKIRLPEMPPSPPAPAAPATSAFGRSARAAEPEPEDEEDDDSVEAAPADDAEPARGAKVAATLPGARASAAGAMPGVVDPMQWWGSLTKQFTEVAANALKDTAGASVPGSVTPPTAAATVQAAATANAAPAAPRRAAGARKTAAAAAPAKRSTRATRG